MVKIFVGNVPDSAESDDLRDLFTKHGKVTEADVVGGKGFGFVHMDTQEDAEAAVAALNGTELKGRNLNVELSTGKPKSGGGRRGGGGDRGRGGRRDYGGGGRRDYPPRDYRSDYGAPRRDYGPPRYGGGYDPYSRSAPDPYGDRNGYYGRDMPRASGGYDARMGGDPYRRPAMDYRDAYARPDPYRDMGYGAAAVGGMRRLSPTGGGYGSYGRRSPPAATGGYYGSIAQPRGRSPPRGPPQRAYPPDAYGRR